MKRPVIISLLLLTFVSLMALNVNDIFEKYRQTEDAQYTMFDKTQLQAQIDSVESESDKRILNGLEKVETLMLVLDAEQRQELKDDLNALDGYSLIESFSQNETPSDSLPPVQGMVIQFMNPSISTDVYGKCIDDDNLEQPLILVDMMGMIFLCYLDGPMPLDELKNAVNVSFDVNDDIVFNDDDDEDDDEDDMDNDDDAIDMSRYSELIKLGDYQIAINGQIMPEIKNQEEASKYLSDNNLRLSSQELIVGRENVNALYPDADAEIVLNYIVDQQ